MKLVLVGAFLILLPAIAVVLYFWGSTMMFPALVSLCIGALPFAVFAVMIRQSEKLGDELEGF